MDQFGSMTESIEHIIRLMIFVYWMTTGNIYMAKVRVSSWLSMYSMAWPQALRVQYSSRNIGRRLLTLNWAGLGILLWRQSGNLIIRSYWLVHIMTMGLLTFGLESLSLLMWRIWLLLMGTVSQASPMCFVGILSRKVRLVSNKGTRLKIRMRLF